MSVARLLAPHALDLDIFDVVGCRTLYLSSISSAIKHAILTIMYPPDVKRHAGIDLHLAL